MHHHSRTPLLLAGIAGALALAACSGGGDDDGGAAAASADSIVAVTAGDMFFAPTDLSAQAGNIAIELDNEGAIPHNLVIEQTGMKVADAVGRSSDTGTIDLEPGTYTFYCDVAGHRQAGMEGTLEVS